MRGVYGPIQVSVDSPGCDTLLLINGPTGRGITTMTARAT
jgi:hypothetical protein